MKIGIKIASKKFFCTKKVEVNEYIFYIFNEYIKSSHCSLSLN